MSIRPTPENPPRATHPVVLDAGQASYELVRSLGQGHHGELLLTRLRYHQGEGGYTVLKRLNRVVRQEDYQRLVEEARLGGQLRHPNIVSVQLLAGSAAEPFLLLEYVEGARLGDLMRLAARSGRGFSEAFACYVTSEVAEGLHYAHTVNDEKGRHLAVVHRDVTPQGILVGRYGEVKLMDFGAAWSRLEGRISTEGDTDVGNLAYSSPERAMLELLDGRSDLFSLGLVLLQLLTGRHLLGAAPRYEAELLSRQLQARGDGSGRVPGLEEMSPLRTSELMKRMRQLSLQEVEEAARPLPEGLRPILHRTLAPRKEDRYSTGAELGQALRDHLWRSGLRYGRAELVAEVSSLTEAVLEDLEESSGSLKRGRTGPRGRRGGPGKAS
ncbi:protein kinase [Vitiosangium sp. GDMCC 1.1324]|uniref:protein kinase domain-containing protein n=1 Tax=Vitiosangium sp. (strain GDMCC 1.1324) TaxID=2138576 RepID=UPI000D39EA76|nr:protein kinase [Vitiosangium sp. GDMCC 1.1324]PTL75673.1 serine/threonine protein kinase [Vitiosangium sp. GDMCC 1.1324]